MSLSKCHNKEYVKQYLIPTKSWITPLEKLKVKNSNANVFLTRTINLEKILVKITIGKNDNLELINELLRKLPNFVYTYCVIMCENNFITKGHNIKENDILNHGFCTVYNKSQEITLELMKKYDGSIKNFYDILDLLTYKSILTQLILAQFNAFAYCGFLHNDIHNGNILVYRHLVNNLLKYKYYESNNFENNLSVTTTFILADYDKSVLIDNHIPTTFKNFFENNYNQYSLYQNIKITARTLIELVDEKYKNALYDIHYNIINKYGDKILTNWSDALKKYIKKVNETNDEKISQVKLDEFKKKFYNFVIRDCDNMMKLYFDEINKLTF